MEDNEDIVPLKSLPNAGIIAYQYSPTNDEDKNLPADNVLIGALGKLKKVSLVGVDELGEFYFASSITGIDEIQGNLKEFYKYLDMYERD